VLGVVAPLAPAAPAAALTGALILTCLALATLIGIQMTYDYTLGAFLRGLADATRNIRWIGGKIASTFEGLDSFIQARIADGIDSLETAAAQVWSALAMVVRETGDAMASLASDTYAAIAGLVHGEIPQQVDAKTRPLTDRLSKTRTNADARIRAEALARSRGIDAVNRDLTHEALARERGIDRIDARLGQLVIPRIRALEVALSDVVGFTRRNLAIRMRTLERLLAAGALGAIAIAAVTRVFPYWQCTNVRGFNKALCRMPVGLLNELLGGALALLVLSDVCRIGQLTRQVAELAQPLLLEVVAVVDAATNCTSFAKPPALALATTQLPASENLVAL